LSVAILIQNIEGYLNIISIHKSFAIYTCAHELLKVDLAVATLSTFCDYFLPINILIIAEAAVGHGFQIMLVNGAFLVLVETDELSLEGL
jgi:hypothetical protein